MATFNLLYNAALLAAEGMGYVVAIDKREYRSPNLNLCFRPFEPAVESQLLLVWRRGRKLPRPAEVLLERLGKEH